MAKRYLILIGVGGLILGSLEYLSRPISSTYLIKNLNLIYPYQISFPPLYGHFGQWLPDFFHAFSFSLICISLFSTSAKSRMSFCIFWFVIDSLFEIGQLYAARIAPYVPVWLERLPILENTKNYFLNGRFDILDLIAISLGAFSAYLLGTVLKHGPSCSRTVPEAGR